MSWREVFDIADTMNCDETSELREVFDRLYPKRYKQQKQYLISELRKFAGSHMSVNRTEEDKIPLHSLTDDYKSDLDKYAHLKNKINNRGPRRLFLWYLYTHHSEEYREFCLQILGKVNFEPHEFVRNLSYKLRFLFDFGRNYVPSLPQDRQSFLSACSIPVKNSESIFSHSNEETLFHLPIPIQKRIAETYDFPFPWQSWCSTAWDDIETEAALLDGGYVFERAYRERRSNLVFPKDRQLSEDSISIVDFSQSVFPEMVVSKLTLNKNGDKYLATPRLVFREQSLRSTDGKRLCKLGLKRATFDLFTSGADKIIASQWASETLETKHNTKITAIIDGQRWDIESEKHSTINEAIVLGDEDGLFFLENIEGENNATIRIILDPLDLDYTKFQNFPSLETVPIDKRVECEKRIADMLNAALPHLLREYPEEARVMTKITWRISKEVSQDEA